MPARHDLARRTPDRVNERPTWLISRAYARSSRLLTAGFEDHGDGIRSYHYRLLAALEQWGPTSQAGLGRDTGIDRSDITAALAGLESRHLVERKVDPDHKRRNIVTLTRQGADTLRRLDTVLDDIQDALLAPLTVRQRRQLVDLLSRIG